MMRDRHETLLQLAQRHVLEGEERVARQRAMIEAMERHRHPVVAAKARDILATMEESLRLAKQHLEAERRKQAVKATGDDRTVR
jgi:hypothetical protein